MKNWMLDQLKDDLNELRGLLSVDEIIQNEPVAQLIERLERMFEGAYA